MLALELPPRKKKLKIILESLRNRRSKINYFIEEVMNLQSK